MKNKLKGYTFNIVLQETKSLSSSADVLDLNVVQRCQRQHHTRRLTQHRPSMLIFNLIGCVLVVLNIVLLTSILSVLGNRLSRDQLSHDESGSSLNISSLLKTELKKEYDGSYRDDLDAIYRRKGELRKPAAHCSLHAWPNMTDGSPIALPLNCNGRFLMVDSQVRSDGESLTVETGGYYYVYSQILYSGDGTEDLDHGRIIHRIRKRKHLEEDESPTTLLQNFQSTPTIRRGRHAYITSSLGGTFYLEKYSRVYVMSSVPRNVDTHSEHSNYFGLFLI